ncbi:MAG: nucleoside-diphosphate kinase [Nitrososphaerales archaeon]|nr:nucleoside-diphosphate kinase [Nitrososphaerales archaeon]
MEQTLIVIKPDGVEQKLVGDILSRFEKKEFNILKMKMFNFTKEQAEELYLPHREKSFFSNLVLFIISGPVVAVILEGSTAIEVVRKMIGSTKSYEAAPGTIRGDYGLGLTENIIHASDSKESFERESKIIF